MAAPMLLRGSSGNLPADLTSFVGRRRDRADVKRLLSGSRLVTLTGPGGVGKTRLSLRAGADVRRAFPDGVWFVELASVTSPALLAHTVATTLGLRTQSHSAIVATLVEHLADRSALLVFDNCEHVVSACATLLDELLRACPHLHVLVTSREPLGLFGETIRQVGPLPVPPAAGPDRANLIGYESVALFVDRARSVVPGFRLTSGNRDAVAEIVRGLDGIPLALELAAVRLRALSPAQLLDRLTDRFALLNSGNRTAPDRQRTLRGCVEWSYDLCTPGEQALWAGASVFSGGFELDAIEAVCPGTGRPGLLLDTLLSLVDKSILVSEDIGGVMRYRMLEAIAQYGLERLRATGELPAARVRHRDFYARLAGMSESEWTGTAQREWMERLRRDHANFEAALEFCATEPGEQEPGVLIAGGLREHWMRSGALDEGRLWLDTLLSRGGYSAETTARGLYAAAWLGIVQADLAYARPLIDRGREVSVELGDVARAQFDNLTGMSQLLTGDVRSAIKNTAHALAVFEGAHAVNQEISALISLQMAYGAAGDTTSALRRHADCVRRCEQIGDHWFRSYSLWHAGVMHWQRGDSQRAITTLRDALRLKRELADRLGAALCIEGIAWATTSRDPRRGAVLLGIAGVRFDALGTEANTLPWVTRPHAECEQELRGTLGEHQVRRAKARGARFGLADGVEYALEEQSGTARRDGAVPSGLTRREREVAGLVAQGLSNKAIASTLVISQRTAETHVENILTKLGFTSRTQIAAWLAREPG
ncbi:ATP-binding protein [Prauserella cavernicola]|uniref:AAA family ATPase n=1 Tax=Prauserella cavernicola TaxID=2800127 RepID=A0A934V2P9_9PSEU|nr:LuxR C-terminal-related transcriptional regulator [Prauserella cavernicola]MBK1783342.1 AAA family ATPase [Prauserella cavernicola]